MKRILFCLAALLVQACLSEDKTEGIDLEKFLSDKEKMDAFFDCVLDVVDECSDENKAWKEIIPTVFSTKCGECTDEQKEMFAKANALMKEKYPERYEELMKKFQ